MDGFKIFPVDIWRLLMSDYCDFETKQNLSSCNKRLRGFFTEYQLKERKKHDFEEEKRIYDFKFEKLSNSRCFWEYYNRKINDYGTISKSFIYSLYRNNNDMNLIDEMSILEFVGPKITDINFPDDIIIVKNQTGKSLGMSLLALIIHDFDIVNAIMSLSR